MEIYQVKINNKDERKGVKVDKRLEKNNAL